MKKLFMFLAVAGLATFGASCSSDDSSTPPPPPPPGEKQLVLSADKTTVNEGDSVTFTVKVGKDVVDADLYIQGTPEVKIDKTHKFETKGQYKVIAKKNDHKDSSVVTITVKEVGEPVDEKKLVLTPSKTEAFVGDLVTFTVKDETGANVSGFTVKQSNGTAVANGIFTATAVGTYKFIASKDGYVTSDEVSVVVTEKPALEGNKVQVSGVDYAIDETRLYINTNADNEALLYSLEDGTQYLLYNLISFTGESSYSQTTMAVIMPANPTTILWPQDVAASNVVTVGVIYVEDGALAEETPEGEQVDASYVWGTKASNSANGKLEYTVDSSVINVSFDGEYKGLYALVQNNSALKSKKISSINALKGANQTVSSKIAK